MELEFLSLALAGGWWEAKADRGRGMKRRQGIPRRLGIRKAAPQHHDLRLWLETRCHDCVCSRFLCLLQTLHPSVARLLAASSDGAKVLGRGRSGMMSGV